MNVRYRIEKCMIAEISYQGGVSLDDVVVLFIRLRN
jgi:hypothetical protein